MKLNYLCVNQTFSINYFHVHRIVLDMHVHLLLIMCVVNNLCVCAHKRRQQAFKRLAIHPCAGLSTSRIWRTFTITTQFRRAFSLKHRHLHFPHSLSPSPSHSLVHLYIHTFFVYPICRRHKILRCCAMPALVCVCVYVTD